MTHTYSSALSALGRLDALPDFFKDKFTCWQNAEENRTPKKVYQMINLLETAFGIIQKHQQTGQELDKIYRHIKYHVPQAKNLDEYHLVGAYTMATLYAKTLNLPSNTGRISKHESPFTTLIRMVGRTHGRG